MDRAVALAVQVASVPLLVALQAASLHPAMALDESRKGRLAQVPIPTSVLLDQDLSIISTIIGGEVVYDPTGVLVPLAHEGALPEVPVPDVAARDIEDGRRLRPTEPSVLERGRPGRPSSSGAEHRARRTGTSPRRGS